MRRAGQQACATDVWVGLDAGTRRQVLSASPWRLRLNSQVQLVEVGSNALNSVPGGGVRETGRGPGGVFGDGSEV